MATGGSLTNNYSFSSALENSFNFCFDVDSPVLNAWCLTCASVYFELANF